MSAYVNRLLDRFSPSQVNMMAAAEPFVRSHSPIAEFDQRPGSEDSFEPEAGAPNVSANLEASPEVGPAARVQPRSGVATVHRKAVAQPIAPSPAAVRSPAITPMPAPLTPSIAVPPVPPPTSTAAPRREPLDPGPLFDIFPRYFDTSESVPASNQPRIVQDPSEPISRPAKPKPPAFEVEATPRRLSPAPKRELELRSPTIQAPPRPAPWVPIERDIAGLRPTTPLVNSTNPSRPALPSPTLAPSPEAAPSPAALHYATPRAAASAPYIPDPGPRPSAERSANARSRVHIGRVEIEVIPSNSPSPAQSGAAAPKQKLSIDSISQIGPLGQYFPSRRLLRLRYR